VTPLARRAAAALVMVLSAACAKRVAVPIPEAEDYLFPSPAEGELSPGEEKALRDAWQQVLAGETGKALSRLSKLERPGAPPPRPAVRTAVGYAKLRAGRPEEALTAFQSALERAPAFVPALAGAGSASARRGDVDGALDFYRRAQRGAPAEVAVRNRLGALKLQVTDRHLSLAQAALTASDLEGAVREYRSVLAAAPELAAVRLSLAELLQRLGDGPGEVAALEADPTGDRQVRLRLGGALLRQGAFERALQVYVALLANDSQDPAARAGLAAARDGLEAAGMPEEYRRIPEAPRVTRADLAALIMVRIKALGRSPAGEAQVALDISHCWAREQIAEALALDLMELYPNHTFQPSLVVRRLDLARAAARVLDRLGWPRAAAPLPTDLPRSHLDYEAVERVLGSGLMRLSDAGAFEPWEPVSGREALEVVDGVARLVGS